MDIKEMTGLEIMLAMKDGKLDYPSMCQTIPMIIESAEKGIITFEVIANEHHINVMGGVHGGFAATVLDTVTGCAVQSMLEKRVSYATIDLTVKMMRPVPKNEKLFAKGAVVNMSKSLGISEASLSNKEGKLLATATSTCLLLK